MTTIEDTMTTAQVARELGVSGESVRSWLRSGRLVAIATPLGHLVPLAEVERVRAERAARAPRTSNPVPAA